MKGWRTHFLPLESCNIFPHGRLSHPLAMSKFLCLAGGPTYLAGFSPALVEPSSRLPRRGLQSTSLLGVQYIAPDRRRSPPVIFPHISIVLIHRVAPDSHRSLPVIFPRTFIVLIHRVAPDRRQYLL